MPEPPASPADLAALAVQGARVAATAEPQRGSLHLSSAPGIPVKAEGFSKGVVTVLDPSEPIDIGLLFGGKSHVVTLQEFRELTGRGHIHSEAWYPFSETYLVDYDGDGIAEHKIPGFGRCYEDNGGDFGRCSVYITRVPDESEDRWVSRCTGNDCEVNPGVFDRYTLSVYRQWIAEGVLDTLQPRFDVTSGAWIAGEAGHIGVFWSGPTVDEPRPLKQPLHGLTTVSAVGQGVMPDGRMVGAHAEGLLTVDVHEPVVTLELGYRGSGIVLAEHVHRIDRVSGNETVWCDRVNGCRETAPPLQRIEGTFIFKEDYDPDSPYFGVGETQLNRGNDVISGNGKGQFGGVITTRPWKVDLAVGDESPRPAYFDVPSV